MIESCLNEPMIPNLPFVLGCSRLDSCINREPIFGDRMMVGGRDYHRHDPNISFPHQNYKVFCLETNPLGKPSTLFLQATGLLVLGVKLP